MKMSEFAEVKALANSGNISEALDVLCEIIDANCYNAGKEVIDSLIDALIHVYQLVTKTSSKYLKLDIFSCPVCFGLLYQPVSIPCGHTFCKSCLLRNESKSCIKCLKRYHTDCSVEDLKVNVTLANIIDALFQKIIRCIHMKREGNDLFHMKKFKEAIAKYSEAINFGSEVRDHLLYSNRSHAYMNIGDYEHALQDCHETIRLQPQWAKGYFRKARTMMCLGGEDERCTSTALYTYLHCLSLDPGITAARAAIHECCSQMLSGAVVSPEKRKLYIKDVIKGLEHLPHSGSRTEVKRGVGVREDELEQVSEYSSGLSIEWVETFEVCTDYIQMSRDLLECPLCVRLLQHPVCTPCGHMFCRACLYRNLDHRPSCPICKHSLQQYLLERREDVVEVVSLFMQRYLTSAYRERLDEHYKEMTEINSVVSESVGEELIPIFVCTSAFPGISCPLHIFEPRYRLMVRQCMEAAVGGTDGARFGMCLPAPPGRNKPFADYGCMLSIIDVSYLPDGRSMVKTVGTRRFQVLERGMRDGYHTARVTYITDHLPTEQQEIIDILSCHESVYDEVVSWFSHLGEWRRCRCVEMFGELPNKPADVSACLDGQDGPQWIWYMASVLPMDIDTTCSLLREICVKKRCETILAKLKEIF